MTAEDHFAPLAVELRPEVRRVLQLAAHVGLLGETPEEIAAFLITREIDDLCRSGALKVGGDQ